MSESNAEFPIVPVSPDELSPRWRELEVFGEPANFEEQSGYLDGYVVGRKAMISFMKSEGILTTENAPEQIEGVEAQVERAKDHTLIAKLQTERDYWHKRAMTDSLTSLPNRAAFMERLEDYAENMPGNHSVLFIDLTKFKDINDTLGHAAGDEVLRETARALSEEEIIQIVTEVLRESVRTQETPDYPEPREHDTFTNLTARLSGDEFAVLLAGVNTEDVAEAIGFRVRKNLLARGIRASLGVAIHQQDETAGEFLDRADKRMYEVKREEDELDKDRLIEDLQESRPRVHAVYERVIDELYTLEGGSEEEFHRLYGQGGR